MTAPAVMSTLLPEASVSLPPWRDDLIPVLLILVLGMALGIGLTCMMLVVHSLRRGRLASRRVLRRTEFAARERRFHPAAHTAPGRWLAIKSGNLHLVQAALGLHNPTPCTWEEGLTFANEQKLFITPPVGGWILVMGASLPEPADDVDKCFRFLLDLSRKLGQVQYFSVNRVVNHHTWACLDQGSVQRAYAWAGRTLWIQGRMTKAEIDLGLKCFDYAAPEERHDFSRVSPTALNTERVPLLASRWSVDPSSIDFRLLKESQGIAGQLSRSKTH